VKAENVVRVCPRKYEMEDASCGVGDEKGGEGRGERGEWDHEA